MTTAQQRATWQTVTDAATPLDMYSFPKESHIAFHAAAREAMPALLAEVAALRAALGALSGAVDRASDYYKHEGRLIIMNCPVCEVLDWPQAARHAADCPVTLARKLLEDSE